MENMTGRISLVVIFLLFIMAAFFIASPNYSLISFDAAHGSGTSLQSTIFGRESSDETESDQAAKLSKGKFLVASRNLTDPRFEETVILLVSYERTGAMGVIINRPSELLVSALFDDPIFKKRKDIVFYGGPVEGSRILLLIRSQHRPEQSSEVFKTVYISGSMDALTRVVDRPKPGEQFRLYAGYAGWASGQLEMELSRGDWYVTSANAKTIFDTDPEKIWPELMRRSSAIQVHSTNPSPRTRLARS